MSGVMSDPTTMDTDGAAIVERQRRTLDDRSWPYQGPRLRALGFEFGIRASTEEVGGYLGTLFEPFEAEGEPRRVYSFLDEPDQDMRYTVYFDGEHIVSSVDAAGAMRHLQWDVNERVIAPNRDYLLVHAATAAADDGRAVILPAAMESGKTTLVSGLVRAGFRYLSDEAAAVDPRSGLLHAYAKALTIDEGSWEVLSDLRPRLPAALEPFAHEQWYVPADAIRPGAVAPTARPAFVVAPRYEREGRTELLPLSRAQALQTLVENAFNFRLFDGRTALFALADVVRRTDCYRLTVADLTEACELLLELFERSEGADDGGVA